MAFDGAGVFTRLRSWVQDRGNGIKIRADFHDNEDDSFAIGLNAITNGEPWVAQGKFFSGTVGAPGISFAGDLDTGLFRSAPDKFAIVTNGVLGLIVDENQDTEIRGNLTLSDNMYIADQLSGGTADALTINVNGSLAALATGQLIMFKPSLDNTGPATADVNTIGVKKIRKIVGGADVDLAAADIKANGAQWLSYDATADSAVGAWIIRSFDASGLLPLSGGTMSGPIVKPNVDDVVIAHSVAGALSLDLALGSHFIVTATANIDSIDVTNVVAGTVTAVTVSAINWGAFTVVHENADTTKIKAPSSTAPIYTASGTDDLEIRVDGSDIHTLYVKGQDIGDIV